MHQILPQLFRMFYPLSSSDQHKWADILSLPRVDYLDALDREALAFGLQQTALGDAVAWMHDGQELMLLFRIDDPRDLAAVRGVYDTIAAREAPLAYTFVRQIPDGPETWDIFHMSKLTYLAHCNRVSGPGS